MPTLLAARMPCPTHLLYLHGFRSSPRSAKAVVTRDRLAAINARRRERGLHEIAWICPQLPASPRAAIELALDRVGDIRGDQLAIIGSSLGGYYATWLAHRLDCRAALLNPAVDPARDLARQLGPQTCWHDPELDFTFTADHLAELRALQLQPPAQPLADCTRLLLVAALDDEVLNCHDMLARYASATQRLSPHGGHALTDYNERHVDAVLDFLGIDDQQPTLD